ncbi:MAG: hypothetical protein B1H12_07825 [Desulfobacteraceae bacterium 4484_190.2]|nr:MAG: hypothetical protein B1H12_07825 [Desulfobacteraceae bacterium 4484_190.2]
MTGEKIHTDLQHELDDDDKVFITEIFFEEIVKKLKRMDARIGTLNCDFAGDQYKNWNIHFKSRGSGFDIVDFEYDEDSFGFSLEP